MMIADFDLQALLSMKLSMNGYGSFVWSAYVVTFAVFIIILVMVYFEKMRAYKIKDDNE